MKETRYASLTSHYNTMHDLCTSSRVLLWFDPPDRRICPQLSPDARSDGLSTRPDHGSPCTRHIRRALSPHPELGHVRLPRLPIPRATVPSRS
jgi:hypothetical protein